MSIRLAAEATLKALRELLPPLDPNTLQLAFWRALAKLLTPAAKAVEERAFPAHRVTAIVSNGNVWIGPKTAESLSALRSVVASEVPTGMMFKGMSVHVDNTLGLDEFRLRRGRT